MKTLRPTLWRTCRAIASTTRLRLLWKIFQAEGLCVGELARATGTSRENASIQLRALNARGLITATRRGKRVIYRAEANPGVDGAEELLDALRQSFIAKIPLNVVFREATAFTHSRRIFLMKTVGAHNGSFDELLEASGMSPISLRWNLSKLEARGFVKARGDFYKAGVPKTPLGKCLMELVCMPTPTSLEITRVISGGQTGADRAALDAAIACGVPYGGWCPKGRLAEEGPIPETYHLQESESELYPVRTRMNVEAADLTLILSRGPLAGGSLLTLEFAKAAKKPCVHIDLLEFQDIFQGLEKTRQNFPRVGKMVLNVAGPRASNDPKIYDTVYQAMVKLLRAER